MHQTYAAAAAAAAAAADDDVPYQMPYLPKAGCA